MTGKIRAPIGFSQVGPAYDHRCAQALIADHIQKVWIDDRACRATCAVCSVATGTISLVSNCASLRIAGLGRVNRAIINDWGTRTAAYHHSGDAVGRQTYVFEVVGPGPLRSHPRYDQLDLLICETTANLLREGGHVRADPALCNYFVERII